MRPRVAWGEIRGYAAGRQLKAGVDVLQSAREEFGGFVGMTREAVARGERGEVAVSLGWFGLSSAVL